MITYKAVCKYDGEYFSDHDPNLTYVIGKVVKPLNDRNGAGIYSASLEYVKKYKPEMYDRAILELEIPDDSVHRADGAYISTSAMVVREVMI